jgi:formylmethanofuran dehydrogenase subunit B
VSDRAPAPPPDAPGGERVTEHVTCLGCGCACDDIRVVAAAGRIVRAERACPLGTAWFGDGVVPARVALDGHQAALDDALAAAAELLARAARPLVYLAPELSCDAQRAAAAIADTLGAALDSVSSASVLGGTLAAQRRGRAGATLGELRNRADLVVFWGVDPTRRYPRFAERFAPDPAGTHVPRGRAGRTVVAVDVGAARALAEADLRVAFDAEHEVSALAVARAVVLGREELVADVAGGAAGGEAWRAEAAALARRMAAARYVGLVYDAEHQGPPGRADSLLALAQALNGPTRCAAVALRGGGNRSGADAVLTWQTGFPMAVDFARGVPRYVVHSAAYASRTEDGADAADDGGGGGRAARDDYDSALLAGDPAGIPADVARTLARVPCVAIGPRASDFAPTPRVSVDTGVAGIHEGGMALRMDDVPLPLTPTLEGPPGAADVLLALGERLRGRRERDGRPADGGAGRRAAGGPASTLGSAGPGGRA